MLRTDLVPARDLRHHRARRKRLRNDPPLLRTAPAPPSPDPAANLDAPARPRSANYMVDHVCEPISSTGLASSRLRRAPQDGVKTSLTKQSALKSLKRIAGDLTKKAAGKMTEKMAEHAGTA